MTDRHPSFVGSALTLLKVHHFFILYTSFMSIVKPEARHELKDSHQRRQMQSVVVNHLEIAEMYEM